MLEIIDLMLKSMDDVDGDRKLNFTAEEEKRRDRGRCLSGG
jgi:hypothetical protein